MIAPYLMLALGIYKFLISLYGFGITGLENRPLLILFALFLSVAFIGQVASVFLFWEVRTTVTLDAFPPKAASDELENYNKIGYESTTNAWDHLQRHLHCCGASKQSLTGYKDYQLTEYGRNVTGVPDSCCRSVSDRCGHGISEQGNTAIYQAIYTDGCLTVLIDWLQEDVTPMIGVYSGVGIAIALVELIAVVLVAAYVAQITRRRQRDDIVWNAVRGHDDKDGSREMDRFPVERTSNHDTQV